MRLTKWRLANLLQGVSVLQGLPRSWRLRSTWPQGATYWLNQPVSKRRWPLIILQEVLPETSCPKLPQRHPTLSKGDVAQIGQNEVAMGSEIMGGLSTFGGGLI